MRAPFWLSIALTLASATVATASPQTKAKAKEHVDRATAAYEKGSFDVALQELTLAYALDPDPQLLYAIGQIHVGLGQCAEAITFYERFLATKPAEDEAAIVRQAIETCHAQAPPPDDKPPPPPPDDKPPPPPEPTYITKRVTAPWYTDVPGDALTGAGFVSGAVGFFLYNSARSIRDDADAATTYEQHEQLVDDAKSRRTVSAVFAAGGVALITAGVIRYAIGDRTREQRVMVTPTAGGGAVTWGMRF